MLRRCSGDRTWASWPCLPYRLAAELIAAREAASGALSTLLAEEARSDRLAEDLAAPCPVCALAAGFHDEERHARRIVPRHLLLPVGDVEKMCNCDEPFSQPGTDVCRHPKHRKDQP